MLGNLFIYLFLCKSAHKNSKEIDKIIRETQHIILTSRNRWNEYGWLVQKLYRFVYFFHVADTEQILG